MSGTSDKSAKPVRPVTVGDDVLPTKPRPTMVESVGGMAVAKSTANIQPKQVKSVPTNMMKRKLSSEEADRQLLSDIESSLDGIDELPSSNNDEAASRREQRRAKKAAQKAKKSKKPLSKGKIAKRIVLTLLVILLAAAGYFAYKLYTAGGKMFKGNPLDAFTTKTRLAQDSNGRTNILVFGTSGYSMDENAWDGAMLTDSIMVLSISQDKDDAYMISLPRDLYVKHTCKILGTTTGKLNETFYCALKVNNNEEDGAKALMAKAGEILGLDIQYYVHADWTALTQSVDAVGGVDIKIESTDPRGIYDSGTKIRYKNGEIAHLDGQKALALSRARNHNAGDYGLAGGNYDREKNQQKILAALQQKALSAGTLLNPSAVNGLIDSLGNNLITNFDSGHIQTLIDVAKNTKAENIKQLPLVGRKDGGPDLVASYAQGGSYKGEAPVAGPFDYSEIQKYIAKNLSSDPVVQESAVVDVLNGSDQAGLAAAKAEELEKDKYTIGQISNSPANVVDKVLIYQVNTDKPGTAAALKKKYGVELQQGLPAGYNTDADFVVIFGEGSADATADTTSY